MIIVTKSAYNKLSAKTKAELMSVVFGVPTRVVMMPGDVEMHNFDWTDRVDLSPGDVEEFIDGSANLSDGTVKGLEIFAKFGPVVHTSKLEEELKDEDGDDYFDSLGTFQRSTTRRVRSVTGDKHAFLLAWNDWDNGQGYYAVTAETHRSLQVYFDLI